MCKLMCQVLGGLFIEQQCKTVRKKMTNISHLERVFPELHFCYTVIVMDAARTFLPSSVIEGKLL